MTLEEKLERTEAERSSFHKRVVECSEQLHAMRKRAEKAEATCVAMQGKHILTATPERDHPKTGFRLNNDKLLIRVWLVWGMLIDKSILLRAITTSEARAQVYAKALRESPRGNILRVTIEPSFLNHLYGGMMDKLF